MADDVTSSSDASDASDASDHATDYDLIRENILMQLDQSKSASSFAYSSEVTTAPNPGLTVEDVGDIGLPLTDRDAKLLIAKCKQSPFGKGGETVVDTGVRNSFELDPSQFTLRNTDPWNACITALVDIIYAELGLNCRRQHVFAELYKLLLYKEGAFFKSHQDSEKTPGMFGTLVVSLPSEHTGGSVLLKHQKDEHIFDSSNASKFGTAFAAWYSDVFHEVQKVTGGYRLVLTYNLVRQGASVPQKAPGEDSWKSLAENLRDYDRVLLDSGSDCSDIPDFLAYSLEHKYSQQGLKCTSLKGNDFARVERLRLACAALKFDLYLALKEKVLHKDDECGSEIFDQEENFKYINDLDGTSQSLTPKYDELNLLNGGDSNDDEGPDEEEHEGYTGNEGAPATYWYRTSMVLIVPSSRKLDFCVNSDKNDFSPALKLLREYHELELTQDSWQYQQLQRLCKLVVQKNNRLVSEYRPYYSWSGRSESEGRGKAECMEQVVQITLKRGWYDLYTSVRAKHKLSQSNLHALGKYLASHEHDAKKWAHLEELLRTETSPEEQFDAFRNILDGIRSVAPSASIFDYENRLTTFACGHFRRLLESTATWCKRSGPILAKIGQAFPSIRELMLQSVKKCSTPTVAAFLLELYRQLRCDEENWSKVSLYEDSIQHFWNAILMLEGPEISISQARSSSWGHPPTRYERDIVTASDLHSVIELTEAHGRGQELPVISNLMSAVLRASGDYAKDYLFPFIAELLKRSDKTNILQRCAGSLHDVVDLTVVGLRTIITEHIGPEPKRLTSLALPAHDCNCKDCSQVNAFLTSPTREQFDLPCGHKRREHLDSTFPSRGTGFETTSITAKPQLWRITKTHPKTYHVEHRAWTLRKKWLHSELQKLARMEDSLLKGDVFGVEVYRAIMSCTVEGSGSVVISLALKEGSGNARKREADDDIGGQAEKKSRVSSSAGGVEVVDLT